MIFLIFSQDLCVKAHACSLHGPGWLGAALKKIMPRRLALAASITGLTAAVWKRSKDSSKKLSPLPATH